MLHADIDAGRLQAIDLHGQASLPIRFRFAPAPVSIAAAGFQGSERDEHEQQVTRHYGSAGIAARVLAALREAQGPDAPVTVDALAPLDQFHGRGPLATQELVALLKPQAGERLLDIGSRDRRAGAMDCRQVRCHVTGVDLTPEFCEAAEALSAAPA